MFSACVRVAVPLSKRVCVCVKGVGGGMGRLSAARAASRGSPVTLICTRLRGHPVGPSWDAKYPGRGEEEEEE